MNADLKSACDNLTGFGFDAPVNSRQQDHLNRWPLARQVYSVAVDGPPSWSARIAVYGEWGTGKTSVLRFVESMARKDGHIVAWFDPWEYGDTSSLWQAFVLVVSTAAKVKLGASANVRGKNLKATSGKVAGVLSKLSKAVPLEGASAVGDGLGLLRNAFAFSKNDLDGLLKVLDGHRVIVIIDDLDRTEAELVPEILFALKQVMDIPGFSFICGFDPKVVGKVLKSRHKGFGNGLNFLEKIIDYPVWLPAPTTEGLKKIALADAGEHCPFIPTQALSDALDLLPTNPRSVRQFVRLCAMLGTQTSRHRDDELNWPIIVTANAIKVRYPEINTAELHSAKFYEELEERDIYRNTHSGSEQVDQFISDHVSVCLKQAGIQGVQPAEVPLDRLVSGLKRISTHLNLWLNVTSERVVYQATLAENSRAVTVKEFDVVFSLWKGRKSVKVVGKWISDHACEFGFQESEVACDLVEQLVLHLMGYLRAADSAFTDRQMASHRACAQRTRALLGELVSNPCEFSPALRVRDWLPLQTVIVELTRLADAQSEVHQKLWVKIEDMLVRLVRTWDVDLDTLLPVMRGLDPHRGFGMDGAQSAALAKRLLRLTDDKLCDLIIRGVREQGFIGSVVYGRGGYDEMRSLLRGHRTQLWERHEAKFMASFRPATEAVRSNAYAFLEWIQHLSVSKEHGDKDIADLLAGKQELMKVLWTAATRKLFRGRFVYRIRNIPEICTAHGVDLRVPAWWQPNLDEFLGPAVSKPRPDSEAPSDEDEMAHGPDDP